MNEGMEFNGIPVPKVHRPPSIIFRDDGNPAAGEQNRPGIYKCVDYRIPRPKELYFEPAEDAVIEWPDLIQIGPRTFSANGYGRFPRVIVEAITPERIDADQAP